MLRWTWRCSCRFKKVVFPLRKYPEMGLLGHVIALFLIFWGPSIPVSTAYTNLDSHSRAQGFPFLHVLTSTRSFFLITAMIRYGGDISLRFDLSFSDDYGCWASFRVSVGRPHVVFGEMSVPALHPFLIVSFVILMLHCMSSYYVVGNPSLDTSFAKNLRLFSTSTLHFVNGFLHGAKAV